MIMVQKKYYLSVELGERLELESFPFECQDFRIKVGCCESNKLCKSSPNLSMRDFVFQKLHTVVHPHETKQGRVLKSKKCCKLRLVYANLYQKRKVLGNLVLVNHLSDDTNGNLRLVCIHSRFRTWRRWFSGYYSNISNKGSISYRNKLPFDLFNYLR